MSSIIKENGRKIKRKYKGLKNSLSSLLSQDYVFITLILLFASTSSFMLGQLYAQDKAQGLKSAKVYIQKNLKVQDAEVVVSKKGKVYHMPWCSGALRIKEENKIYFENKQEAELKGYAPAKNCEGL